MKKWTRRVRFFRPAPIKRNSQKIYNFAINNAQIRPLTTFFALLALLLALIVGGNLIRKHGLEESEVLTEPKLVNTFSIGSAPRISVSAQIEKSGVITVVSQASAIVNKINTKEGANVWRGSNLISLSSNYSGGNAPVLGSQLAAKQHQNIVDTFDLQKDLISKQREVAEKTDSNSDELRSITEKSFNDTRNLISLNDDILNSINENLTNLETTNVGGVNDNLILQSKQLKSQFTSANNQLKAAQRNSEHLEGGDNQPAELSNLGKDITLKQLELQEKGLELSKETSLIQLRIAQVAASIMTPSSPTAGTVERIHIRAGQAVSPGTPLVTISTSEKSIRAIALIPVQIAKQVSQIEQSYIYIEGQKLEIAPTYVSTEATNGQLYSVIYDLPSEYQNDLTDFEYIKVEIPIGYASTGNTIPFVPLDSIYQTQDESFVFVVENEHAVSRPVSLGAVQGRFVEVKNGLNAQDLIITNRNVISGEKIRYF